MPKIVIIASKARSLINFRGDLIKKWVEMGFTVQTIAPEKDFHSKIRELGAQYHVLPISRTGLNPLIDFVTILRMIKEFKKLKPDFALFYTIKPVIYGSIAARLAGVNKVFSIITGLGYIFTEEDSKKGFLRSLILFLYKFALSKNELIFFQNPDDRELFLKQGIIKDKEKTILINGSGVNVDYFKPNQLQRKEERKKQEISFLFIGRLLMEKGIREFIEAARILKNKYPDISFKIIGSFDSNPSGIKKEEIREWQDKNIIEYLGYKEDVRPFIEDCSVFVLPSYREGTPRSVLEAMSMGKPIVTTDVPGCRETVKEGINGFLVPKKDPEKLGRTMEKFIINKDLIDKMGMESRLYALEKFDVRKVNEIISRAMGLK